MKQKENVTCRKTGSFFNREVNCDLLHDMWFPGRSILLRDHKVETSTEKS